MNDIRSPSEKRVSTECQNNSSEGHPSIVVGYEGSVEPVDNSTTRITFLK